MTNQEAMRGRAWEFIKLRWRIPGAETVAELAAEFALQEVASREARIEKLEAAAKPAWELITALALAVEWELAPEIKASLKVNSQDLGEALKEQP